MAWIWANVWAGTKTPLIREPFGGSGNPQNKLIVGRYFLLVQHFVCVGVQIKDPFDRKPFLKGTQHLFGPITAG